MNKWKNKILNWAEEDKEGKQLLDMWQDQFIYLIESGVLRVDDLTEGWGTNPEVDMPDDYLPKSVIRLLTEEEDYEVMGECRSKAIGNYPVYYQELEEARIEYFIAFKNSYGGKELIKSFDETLIYK